MFAKAGLFILKCVGSLRTSRVDSKSAVLERLRKIFNINKCSVMRGNFRVKANNVAAKSGGGGNANGHVNLAWGLGLKEKLYLFKNVQKSEIFERIPKTKIEKISFFFQKMGIDYQSVIFFVKKKCIFFAPSGNKMGIKIIM